MDSDRLTETQQVVRVRPVLDSRRNQLLVGDQVLYTVARQDRNISRPERVNLAVVVVDGYDVARLD